MRFAFKSLIWGCIFNGLATDRHTNWRLHHEQGRSASKLADLPGNNKYKLTQLKHSRKLTCTYWSYLYIPMRHYGRRYGLSYLFSFVNCLKSINVSRLILFCLVGMETGSSVARAEFGKPSILFSCINVYFRRKWVNEYNTLGIIFQSNRRGGYIIFHAMKRSISTCRINTLVKWNTIFMGFFYVELWLKPDYPVQSSGVGLNWFYYLIKTKLNLIITRINE